MLHVVSYLLIAQWMKGYIGAVAERMDFRIAARTNPSKYAVSVVAVGVKQGVDLINRVGLLLDLTVDV